MQQFNFQPINYGQLTSRTDRYNQGITNSIQNAFSGLGEGIDQYLANEQQRRVWDNQLAQQERANRIQDEELARQKQLRDSRQQDMMNSRKQLMGMFNNRNITTNGQGGIESVNSPNGDYVSSDGSNVSKQAFDMNTENVGNRDRRSLEAHDKAAVALMNSNKYRNQQMNIGDEIASTNLQDELGDDSDLMSAKEPEDVSGFDNIISNVSKYGLPAKMAMINYLNASNPDDADRYLAQLQSSIMQYDQNEALNASARASSQKEANDKSVNEEFYNDPVMQSLRRGDFEGKSSADINMMMNRLDAMQARISGVSDPLMRMQLQGQIDEAWSKLKGIRGGKRGREKEAAFQKMLSELAKGKSYVYYNGVWYDKTKRGWVEQKPRVMD